MAAAGKPESENKPYSCPFVAAKMAPWARSSSAASSVGKSDVSEGFLMSSVSSRVSAAVFCHVMRPSFRPLQGPQHKCTKHTHLSSARGFFSLKRLAADGPSQSSWTQDICILSLELSISKLTHLVLLQIIHSQIYAHKAERHWQTADACDGTASPPRRNKIYESISLGRILTNIVADL